MADDWIEEEDRAPISLAELNGERNTHFGYNNNSSSNQYGFDNQQGNHYGRGRGNSFDNDHGNQYGRGRGNSFDNQHGNQYGRGRGNFRGRGSRNRGGMRRNDGYDNQIPVANNQSTLTFQIAQRDVGRLIGTKGCNINKIKSETQCSIDVGEENQEIKRSVDIHIHGEDEKLVAQCKIAIEKHLGYSSLGNPDSDIEDEPIDWNSLADDAAMAEKKRWAKSVPLNKNFYVEHSDVKNLSPSQVKEFRVENNQIKVYNFNSASSDPLMNPVCTFNQAFEPYPEILNTIEQQGFERPSPIQAQAWPYLLSGKVYIIIKSDLISNCNIKIMMCKKALMRYFKM